ncbi:MAG: class I SAM-dependent methyltransferase [Bryobacteraceae bacterium]
MPAGSARAARRNQDFLREFERKGWYHSFELPDGERIDGFISLDTLRERYRRFPIPEDLTGRRVLDIGAWDGWFSFEAERRGAAVTAIDCVEYATFRRLHQKLASKVDYRIVDLFDLAGAGLGTFDYVFFLGVLYHLKHPLLGLETVCALTREIALVDSFVTDGDTWQEHPDELPAMEFYETDELAGRLDNWYGPSVSCLLALCRAAGFARVELLHAQGHLASVACYRRWEPVPAGGLRPAPRLASAVNHADFGINFTARRDQYVTCWFSCERETLQREDLRLEVGGFGAPALYVKREDGSSWAANFRLPPGLEPGWKEARLRLADTPFGDSLRIAVDVPLNAGLLGIREVCDGVTWDRDTLRGKVLSLWVAGLGENADRSNVRIWLGEVRLRVDYVSEPDGDGFRQLNAAAPEGFEPGAYSLRVEFGAAAVTHASPVRVTGVR